MEMRKRLCIVVLILMSALAGANAQEWRKIKNKFYSLELPDSWKPQEGMPGNGVEPGEREARGYHLYYFAWRIPVKTREEMLDCIGIDIQTYKKIDKTPLTVRDIEKAVILPLFSSFPSSKTETYSSKDELRLTVLRNSKEMDGSAVRYRCYYLLKQSGIGVHCMEISFRDDLLKRKPETKKLVKRILDSFVVGRPIK